VQGRCSNKARKTRNEIIGRGRRSNSEWRRYIALADFLGFIRVQAASVGIELNGIPRPRITNRKRSEDDAFLKQLNGRSDKRRAGFQPIPDVEPNRLGVLERVEPESFICRTRLRFTVPPDVTSSPSLIRNPTCTRVLR
jgi:hypothetical protein